MIPIHTELSRLLRPTILLAVVLRSIGDKFSSNGNGDRMAAGMGWLRHNTCMKGRDNSVERLHDDVVIVNLWRAVVSFGDGNGGTSVVMVVVKAENRGAVQKRTGESDLPS